MKFKFTAQMLDGNEVKTTLEQIMVYSDAISQVDLRDELEAWGKSRVFLSWTPVDEKVSK